MLLFLSGLVLCECHFYRSSALALCSPFSSLSLNVILRHFFPHFLLHTLWDTIENSQRGTHKKRKKWSNTRCARNNVFEEKLHQDTKEYTWWNKNKKILTPILRLVTMEENSTYLSIIIILLPLQVLIYSCNGSNNSECNICFFISPHIFWWFILQLLRIRWMSLSEDCHLFAFLFSSAWYVWSSLKFDISRILYLMICT